MLEMNSGLLRMPSGLGENSPDKSLLIEPFVCCLVSELDQAGVQWTVLRNAEELPRFTRYDLDILTLPSDYKEFVQTVVKCAKQTGWRVAGTIKKRCYTCVMLTKGSLQEGFSFLPVDIFTALEFRGLHYFQAQAVLDRRCRTASGIWSVPPEVDAVITLLKEWLPHGDLKKNSRVGVVQNAQGAPEDFSELMASATGSDWAALSLKRIGSATWKLSKTEHRSLRRAVCKRTPWWLMKLFGAGMANVLHWFRPSLGMVVCLAGADGSGKTTLAEGLAVKTFKRPFKGCRYIHGNIGILPRFRDMRKALGIGNDQEASEPETLQGMMEPIPAWKSVLLASYYAVDFLLARLLIRRWRGQWLLTVMDRSFYDYYYQLGHRNCPRRVLDILSVLIPKPDLLLCVEGDADAIHARKPELTIEEIQTEQKILRELNDRFPFARILNGRDGVEAMVDAGTQEVFQCLEEGNTSDLRYSESAFCIPKKKRPCGEWQKQMGGGSASFQTLEMNGAPLAAVPAGLRSRARSWGLFPATSLKRTWLRNGLCALAAVGLDRRVCSLRDPLGGLVSEEEITELLNRLTELCSGEQPDWLLTWPAQRERQRMYLIFRCTSRNISGVVKIGAGEFNQNQFSNEADVLRHLAGKELSFTIPSVLFQKNLDENRTALALGNFPSRPKRMLPEAAAAAGRQVMTALKQRAGGLTHGDLGVANMLRSHEGRLFVLDWENASAQAPRLTDSVGLWLSSRQSQVVREPERACYLLRQAFAESGEVLTALQFLSDRDNLAARKILENWEC